MVLAYAPNIKRGLALLAMARRPSCRISDTTTPVTKLVKLAVDSPLTRTTLLLHQPPRLKQLCPTALPATHKRLLNDSQTRFSIDIKNPPTQRGAWLQRDVP